MKATSLLACAGVVLLLCATLPSTQPPAPAPAQFDHSALMVSDLDRSVAFYQQVLGLQPMAAPFPAEMIRWFGAGDRVQLHLVKGAAGTSERPISTHLAFRVASMEAFTAHLGRMKVKYRNFQTDEAKAVPRGDGVQQIYFQDPDGYWIEVNDAK